jgi:rubrerythrin
MSRWKTSYDSQQLIQCAQNALTALESIKVEGMSQPDLAEYSRLLKILKVLATRFSKLDPELLSLNAWSNFPSWLNEARNQIITFGQNRGVGHLQNANNNVDQIINVLKPLDTGSLVEEFKSVADANAIFQQKIVQELESVRARGEEIKKQLNSLSEAIAQGKTRLDENNQTIQQQKARLDQAITEFQKQFSDAQEKRTKDFADSIKKNSDEFTAQEKKHDTEFRDTSAQRKKEYEAFFEDARKQSNAHLDFLQKREAEVNKIFGAIGTTAFAGNFKTTADSEASAANLWRWIALCLMAAMIAVGGYAFYYSIGHETDWRVFAFRLGTVIVLAIPAVYAANESSKHRERERQNRKTHLELASLDAYLVLLPEAERNKIKGNLTDKFFGVPVLKEKADEVTQKDLFGVLTTVLNNLTKGK